jgi:hypothetical protein
MKAPAVLLLIVLGLVVIFTIANWGVIMTPATVSLLVADIQAPIGFILVLITLLLSALFLAFVVYLQTTVLLDARRHSKELAAQRDLADKAEASRFTDLRAWLDAGLSRLADQITDSKSASIGRVDRLDAELRTLVEQSVNGLAAHIGELEDRMERGSNGGGQFN